MRPRTPARCRVQIGRVVLLTPQFPSVPAGRQSRPPARLFERLHPMDRARDPDPENPRRLVPRKTVLNHGLDHPNAKSLSMPHPRQPPPGLEDESCFAPIWESLTIQFALNSHSRMDPKWPESPTEGGNPNHRNAEVCRSASRRLLVRREIAPTQDANISNVRCYALRERRFRFLPAFMDP
jgi:hypothetical protein